MQQAPGHGGFPLPRWGNQDDPIASKFQRRRMNKVKVSAQALQLDRQILFEKKNKFAVIERQKRGTSCPYDAIFTPPVIFVDGVLQACTGAILTKHRAITVRQKIEYGPVLT